MKLNEIVAWTGIIVGTSTAFIGAASHDLRIDIIGVFCVAIWHVNL